MTFVINLDGSDLCEANGGELGTACSLMQQLPCSFSITSLTAKIFFLATSLLKVKKLKPSLVSLYSETCVRSHLS